jgi:hypothetical protein
MVQDHQLPNDRRQVVAVRIGSDQFQEIKTERRMEALECHKSVLSALCWSGVVRSDLGSDGYKRNHAILVQEVAIDRISGSRVDHRDRKDGIPTPDLGLL